MAALALHASARNKTPITDVLKSLVAACHQENFSRVDILEIASGTGEHAAFFSENIPNIIIQPTEPNLEFHSSIIAWTNQLSEHALIDSILSPIELDVLKYLNGEPLPEKISENKYDLIVCINMIHISPFETTAGLFNIAKRCVRPRGFVFLYGPFRVDGFMVESNIAFDLWLKGKNLAYGVRDLEAVQDTAKAYGFTLYNTIEMPANNLSVIFQNNQ